MPGSLDDKKEPSSQDPRNTPEQIKRMTTIMLVFAILNSINLISAVIPLVNYILFAATFILAIFLLLKAPKNYKANWAAWLEIAAEVALIATLVAMTIGAKSVGLTVPQLAALIIQLTGGNITLNPGIVAVLQHALLPAAILSVISFILRFASVVFGYMSYSALKKAKTA